MPKLEVIKRTGKTEAFSPSKMMKALVRAGAPRKVAAQISKKSAAFIRARKAPVPTAELRKLVVKELDHQNAQAALAFDSFRKAAATLQLRRAPPDILERVKILVGKAGVASLSYGGFEIIVTNPRAFDWERVFKELTDHQSHVWVTHRGGRIVILSKTGS